MAWSIVGRRFSAEQFEVYVAAEPLRTWQPEFVVVHNTAVPSLAQRPHGFTPQHIENLYGFYVGKGWSGCPHLFVDQNGIWVLNPLGRPGVHSPSWNKVAWGVEMLGEYGSEEFHSGPGALVRDNAVAALAALCKKGRFPPEAIRFHKEDPRTTHTTCPGSRVSKDWIVATVRQLMTDRPEPQAKLVVYRHGLGDDPAAVLPLEIREGRAYASGTDLARVTGVPVDDPGAVLVRDALGPRYTLKWVGATKRLYAVEV